MKDKIIKQIKKLIKTRCPFKFFGKVVHICWRCKKLTTSLSGLICCKPCWLEIQEESLY